MIDDQTHEHEPRDAQGTITPRLATLALALSALGWLGCTVGSSQEDPTLGVIAADCRSGYGACKESCEDSYPKNETLRKECERSCKSQYCTLTCDAGYVVQDGRCVLDEGVGSGPDAGTIVDPATVDAAPVVVDSGTSPSVPPASATPTNPYYSYPVPILLTPPSRTGSGGPGAQVTQLFDDLLSAPAVDGNFSYGRDTYNYLLQYNFSGLASMHLAFPNVTAGTYSCAGSSDVEVRTTNGYFANGTSGSCVIHVTAFGAVGELVTGDYDAWVVSYADSLPRHVHGTFTFTRPF